MTAVQPAAPRPVELGIVPGVEEPSRFAAYATGPTEPGGVVARLVERLLTPELSRMARVSRPRSRS